MTASDDLTRLKHMRDAALEVLEFMSGQTRENLKNNRMLQLAVVKALEIIGSVSNNISHDCQQRYPQIPWRGMVGMRNRLVHVYFGIDLDVVWRTVQEDLDPLLVALEIALLAEQDD